MIVGFDYSKDGSYHITLFSFGYGEPIKTTLKDIHCIKVFERNKVKEDDLLGIDW